MAKKKNAISKQEAQFAYYFLQRLGGNVNNGLLIKAVVAWMRHESGGLNKVIGNNPFNIRVSKYASGYRKSRRKNGGHFAIFKDLKTGAKAAAYLLLSAGNDARGYGKAVKAALRNETSAEGQRTQAIDFLAYIAMSKWDASHYGLGKHPDIAHAITTSNSLLADLNLMVGGIPSFTPWLTDQQETAQRKYKRAQKDYNDRLHRPKAPHPLNPPTPGALTYIDPQEARGFLMARHRAGDMGNLTG